MATIVVRIRNGRKLNVLPTTTALEVAKPLKNVNLDTHVDSRLNGKCFARMDTTSKRTSNMALLTSAWNVVPELTVFLLLPIANRARQASCATARPIVTIP